MKRLRIILPVFSCLLLVNSSPIQARDSLSNHQSGSIQRYRELATNKAYTIAEADDSFDSLPDGSAYEQAYELSEADPSNSIMPSSLDLLSEPSNESDLSVEQFEEDLFSQDTNKDSLTTSENFDFLDDEELDLDIDLELDSELEDFNSIPEFSETNTPSTLSDGELFGLDDEPALHSREANSSSNKTNSFSEQGTLPSDSLDFAEDIFASDTANDIPQGRKAEADDVFFADPAPLAVRREEELRNKKDAPSEEETALQEAEVTPTDPVERLFFGVQEAVEKQIEEGNQGYGVSKPKLTKKPDGSFLVSPRVRLSPMEDNLPQISIDSIKNHFVEHYILEYPPNQKLPAIIQGADGRLVLGEGDIVYAKVTRENQNLVEGVIYDIVRQGVNYRDPETGVSLGHEAKYVGSAELINSKENVNEFRIIRSKSEVLLGDLILPHRERVFESTITPKPSKKKIRGEILSIVGSTSAEASAKYDIVVLNKGHNHGLNTGNILLVSQKASYAKDPVNNKVYKLTQKKGTPPSGWLMVFRTFNQLSYGIILDSKEVLTTGSKFYNL